MLKILDYYGKEITEDQAKETALAEHKYDTAEEALIDLIINKGENKKLHWETSHKIDKIKEDVYYNGVKLDMYFEWNNHVFMTLMGFYYYVDKTKTIIKK